MIWSAECVLWMYFNLGLFSDKDRKDLHRVHVYFEPNPFLYTMVEMGYTGSKYNVFVL